LLMSSLYRILRFEANPSVCPVRAIGPKRQNAPCTTVSGVLSVVSPELREKTEKYLTQ